MRIIHIISFFILITHTYAQDNTEDSYVINEINLSGNKRTNGGIILREMEFAVGDTLRKEELIRLSERSRNNIFNTRLFVTVEVAPEYLEGNRVNINLILNERWYFFPTPIFELVDRNFNHWWVNEGADLSRTVYGLRLTQHNLSGNNDRLSFTMQFGFTQRFSFTYAAPYIDKERKHGLRVSFRYLTNNRFIYNTESHVQQNIRADEVIRREYRGDVTYSYRNQLYHTHTFELGYSNIAIDDTVTQLNPNYLPGQQSETQFFRMGYQYRYDRRDNIAYPLLGQLVKMTVDQYGLGIFDPFSLTIFRPYYSRYSKLGDKFYAANSVEAKVSFPENQPYILFNAMGFGNTLVRGHELEVIEGQHLFLNKNELKYELLKIKPYLGDWIPLKQFREFPISAYLKVFGDIGYVANRVTYPENDFLANQLIYGGGIGLDLVTFYDGVFRFEGSYNTLDKFRFGVNVRVAID